MRHSYNETGGTTPVDKLTGWFYDRFWRVLLVIVLSIAVYFAADMIPVFIEFIQSGGDVSDEDFKSVPIGSPIFYGKLVAITFINYLILHKRI